MPTRSLTVASVARIKPPKRGQADYFDSGYPGLALRVSYGGAKTWIYFYRLHAKLRRLSLGRFPGMELDDARNAWRSARLAVSKGESPAHIKPTTADTFGATAEEWLKRDQAKNRSIDRVQQAIKYNALPVWRERLIAGITRRDVIELIDAVVDRGALTMARRLHSHLHRLFRWAVGRGIIETNPMADLPKPGKAVKRDRVLDNHELKAAWKAAEKAAWPYGPAIRLLILTAARREEIGALRWSEIHNNEIRLPSERSKSGEARIIPLSPPALALIQNLPRVGEHVFSKNGSGLDGWSKAKRAIDATAAEMNGGALPPWRLHDLRRTTATGLQRLGIGLQVVESVLGHVSGSRAGIVGVYQRHQFEVEKRQALEAWAAEVTRITAGGRIQFISASFAGSGSLVAAATVEPIDMRWVDAVGQADEHNTTEPLLAYLQTPGTRFGPGERWWLEQLFKRMKGFTRKKGGNWVPLGHKSREEQHAIAHAHVCDLQSQGLSEDAAIDAAATKLYATWYANDKGGPGSSLKSYIKHHQKNTD
jgi:integrase